MQWPYMEKGLNIIYGDIVGTGYYYISYVVLGTGSV